MLVLFKQAVHMGGKDYKKGVHEVHEDALKHAQAHKLILAGLIVEQEASKVISAESLQQRQAKLAEKLMASSAAKLAAQPKASAPVEEEVAVEATESEPEVEFPVEEEEVKAELPSKDKKKKKR